MENEVGIRLGAFLGLFALFALIEAMRPARVRKFSRSRRWFTNWSIVIVDPEPDLELVEGETRQLELYKTYSNDDVDTEDIADEASWSIVQGQSIANIDEDGELTMSDNFSGYNSDEIRVEAEYLEFTDEIELPISNESN